MTTLRCRCGSVVTIPAAPPGPDEEPDDYPDVTWRFEDGRYQPEHKCGARMIIVNLAVGK